MCPLSKRPILMSHYAICLKVCLECCRCRCCRCHGCGGHKRKHLSLTRERGPRDLSFRTSGGLNSGGEEGGVGGTPPASHHPSPWGFKTERERRICLPGVFPSGAMRLARALRLCAPMHISCIVSFECGVRSPSILHLFFFMIWVYPLDSPFSCVCVQYYFRWVPTCPQAGVHLIYFVHFVRCLCVPAAGPPPRRSVWHCGRVRPFCPREQRPSHSATSDPLRPGLLAKAVLPPVGAEA